MEVFSKLIIIHSRQRAMTFTDCGGKNEKEMLITLHKTAIHEYNHSPEVNYGKKSMTSYLYMSAM